MFKNLTNFGFERTGNHAFGFYIAYLFLGLLLGSLTGGLYSLFTGDQSFESGLRVGNIIAIFYCLGLAITVAHFKGLLSSFKFILIVVLSGILAVILGSLGGLIPVAYLTTRKNLHNKTPNADAQKSHIS